MAKTDEQLVAATLEGDPKAFEEIIQRYQNRVFSIVYHYLGRRNEVEDMAQEVFLKLFRSLGRYDTQRSLEAWISKIAVNTCLDELRRIRVRKTSLFSDLAEEDEQRAWDLYDRFARADGFNEADSKLAFGLLQKLISALSEKDRMAFVLREIEGLGYDEIAEMMGVSEVAVRIRVSRCRTRLIEDLGKFHYFDRIES